MNTIIHKKSKVSENGQAKLPTKEQLVYGELAVNYAKGLETISLKNDDDEIVTFRTNEYYDEIITENEKVTAAALTIINDKLEDLKTEVAGKTNNKGTVTSVTVTGKNGLTGSGTVTSAGTITISHATASTTTTSSATTLSHNGTFKVPSISRDNYGHITAVTETTYTLPSDSDTHYTSKNIIGASSGATANASATNGNVWLNHIENGSITSKHNIVGSGGTTVKSDTNGKITINSTAPDHTKTSPTAGTAGTTSATSGTTISIPYVTVNASGHVTTYGTRNHTISASDLGLGQVLKYCGKTTTELTDGSTVKTIVINGANHSATTGCVVFYEDKEFVYNGSTWELLGAESTYKVVQSAVTSPNANGDSTAFIDTISQDENGVITVTKKNVKFPAETYTKHEDTSTLSGAYGTSATTTGYAIKQITVDDKGHVTGIVTGTTPDTKVTSVANHYTPSSSTTATNTAGGSTLGFGGAVITGIQMDAKGHITGAVTSKLPSNPNTDTATTQTGHYSPSITAQTISGGSGQLSHNGTFTVPSLTFDNKGHLVSGGTTTYTLPSDSNTHHTAYLRTASSSTATGNTTDTSNGIYFNLVENNTVRSNTILSGTSNVTVTSPTAGTVVITGPGTGTTSTYGLVKISNGDVATIANENGLAAGMDHSHSDYATGINNLEERLDNLVTEIEDNELVTAGALTYLEGKLDDITTEIENNEYVTAQALTDLDTRVSNALTGIVGSDGVSVTRDSETGSVDIKLSLKDSSKANVETTTRTVPSAATNFYPVQLDKNGVLGVYPGNPNAVASYPTTNRYYLLGHSSTISNSVATTLKSSNVSVSGGTMVLASGGFFQTSDERKKDFIGEIPMDFEKLRSIPKSYFTWKEGDDKTTKIGTSAQAVQKIYPEIVNVDDETGELSLDYALLSVIALKAVDVLYEENQQIKYRLERIEKALGL